MEVNQETIQALHEANDESQRLAIGKELCALFFKDDDGNPFKLTDGQSDVFMTILQRKHHRAQAITPSQYGKSEVVAMAIVLRSISFQEPWTVVSGQQKKTDIIMGKAIKHLFDHPSLERQIDPLSVPKLERLKHEKSQDRVTWLDGGEIRTLTASAQNRKAVKEVVTGQGARNIVEDEASLIPDDLQAMIMRMLGGFKDSFILKIGNPFYRNHFLKTWQSDKYYKIFIDDQQALKEGRFTEEFLQEMMDMPFYDVLYRCKFPNNNEITPDGYRKLITDELLENAFITQEEYNRLCTKRIEIDEGVYKHVPEGHPRLGADIAGAGTDRSSYVLRYKDVARLLEVNHISDTMQQVPIVENYADMYNIHDGNISLDYGGLGQGVGDRLAEKGYEVNRIMFGGASPEPQRYINNRAYMYYQAYKWLKSGGKILKDDSFYELLVINYKENSEKRFQIQSKEELKKSLGDLGLQVTSPDVADAFALTFADNTETVDEDDFEII